MALGNAIVDVLGAVGDVAEAGGDVAKILSQTLQQLIALVYNGASWSSRSVETLVAKAEMLIEKISEPSQPPPAPGVNEYIKNDDSVGNWHYWRYNELYYLEELQRENGPEKEFLKAKGVCEKLLAEEKTAYLEIKRADIKLEVLRGKLKSRIADRDFYTSEWDDAYHQINGKPSDSHDNKTFETVEGIKKQIEEQEAKKRNAQEKLKELPIDRAKELGVLDYTDGLTLSLTSLVDLMLTTVKDLEKKYSETKKHYESSKYYRELVMKNLEDDIERRETSVKMYESKKAALKPEDVEQTRLYQETIDKLNKEIRDDKIILDKIKTFGEGEVKEALSEASTAPVASDAQ